MRRAESSGKSRGHTRGAEGGFTLLEVLVAVAILALSLTSLLGSQIDSLRATRYAQGVTAAAFLAEYQLAEIEWQQQKEGWQETDAEYEGEFDEQGWPDISYVCLVDFIELPEYNEMLEAKTDADEAAGEDAYMDAGDEAFSALALVWPIVKEAIEHSIRKVSCVVHWKDGNLEHEFEAQTFWTDPQRLAQIPALGGEFSAEDDDSSDEGPEGGGTDGSTGGAGGVGGPVTPGTMRPGTGSSGGGMMGGK